MIEMAKECMSTKNAKITKQVLPDFLLLNFARNCIFIKLIVLSEELFDEVKDLRDRARMIRKKRARTRYFVSTITDDLKDLADDSTASPNMRRSFKDLINTINAMQGIRIPGAEEGKNSAKNKLFQNEARASIASRAFTSVGPEGRKSRRTNILPPSFL